jgi:hypothetical protein
MSRPLPGFQEENAKSHDDLKMLIPPIPSKAFDSWII